MNSLGLRVKALSSKMPTRKKKELGNSKIETNPSLVEELQDLAKSEECIVSVKWLQDCLQSTDVIQQAATVKKIGQSFQKLQSGNQAQVLLCCKILADVYMKLESKNILKRTVASALQGSPEQLHSFILSDLHQALAKHLGSVSDDTEEAAVRQLVDTLIACFDNFPLGEKCVSAALTNVLQFDCHVLILLTQHLRKECSPLEATHHCQNVQALVRSTVLTLQKCSCALRALISAPGSRDFILELLAQILHNTLALLSDDDAVLLDCRMHSGMAVPLLLRHLLGPDYYRVIFQVAFSQSMADQGNLCDIAAQLEDKPADLDFTISLLGALPLTSQLCLTTGLLSTLTTDELAYELVPKHSTLVDILLPELLRITESGDSAITITCCRGLLLWTQRAQDVLEHSGVTADLHERLLGGSQVSQQLMDFLWSHWEHFIDGVRHLARDIFTNVVMIHQMSVKKSGGRNYYVPELVEQLLTMPAHRRSKYSALCCIVDRMGAKMILECQPSLPNDLLEVMEDKIIASHASELFEKLFKSHLVEMKDDTAFWQQLWLMPILTALCQDSKAVELEHILTQLLKCYPESLHYITSMLTDEDYPTSEKYLGALIKAVKTAKVLGIIKTEDGSSDQLWNNVLPFTVLRQAMYHTNDEIRLDAFGLLCESCRSTEAISLVDIELIQSFLPQNMCNQSPAFRQQFLAYMKKLIVRIKDGGQVLRRKANNMKKKDADLEEIMFCQSLLKSYQEILNWIGDVQFACLHLGANFPRRGTALQILTLLHQIIGFHSCDDDQFTLNHCLTYQNAQTLLECLRDTYEVNKALALDILKIIPAELLGFQSEQRISALFEASFALASSPRPAESVTAAYLLRLLVHYPSTWPVAMATKLLLEEAAQGTQGDQPSSSGRNTPILDIKDRENQNLQDYLNQTVLLGSNQHTFQETALAVLELLLFQLQGEIGCAKYSLLEAATGAPMYGLLFCIRTLLSDIELSCLEDEEAWKTFLARMIDASFVLAEVVSPVVNNASPEGHLPMDSDPDTLLQLQCAVQKALGCSRDSGDIKGSVETDGDDITIAECYTNDSAVKVRAVTAQMLLLCSWRTMKEISLLLGELCQRAPLAGDDSRQTPSLLSRDQILQIGEYFTSQLAETKHRGAFEQAYVGFCKMCATLWSAPGNLHQLPQRWLQELFEQLHEDGASPKLCRTRRSGGVPFMVQALVSTEPAVTNHACFKEVMNTLLPLVHSADYAHSDARIHALNILRALFRDMRLGENVMPYVADGMKAAIVGFKAKSWAVRNSSTLLFSALMTRIFGVKRSRDENSRKNCMTGRVFFQRFPTLHQFLLEELASVTQDMLPDQPEMEMPALSLQPSLYPVLLLLSRLYPSALEGSDSNLKLAVFIPYIQACGDSAIIKTRTLAAQALIPLIPVNAFHTKLEELISSLPSGPSVCAQQNQMHGILIQVQQLLLDCHSAPESVLLYVSENLCKWLSTRLWICSRLNPCLFTRTAFLDVLDAALSKNLIDCETSLIVDVHQYLQQVIENPEDHSCTPGSTIYFVSVARLLLNISVITADISTGSRRVRWSSQELSALGSAVRGDFHSLSAHDDLNWQCGESASYNVNSEPETDFLHMLICRLLDDHQYEVRLAVMQWLRALLHSEDDTANDYEGLQEDWSLHIAPNSTFWLRRFKKSQYCAQHLLSSRNVIFSLVSMAMYKEQHPQCLTELFHLLCSFPLVLQLSWPQPEEPTKLLNSLEKLDLILQRGEAEYRDELRCAMLRFSGCLVPQVYLDIAEAPEENDLQPRSILEEWTDAFLLCCSSEQSLATRSTAAHVLNHVASYLLLDPHHILGSACCMVWCSLVRLLTDDEPSIKQKVAGVINIFDECAPMLCLETTPHDIQCVVALDLVIGYFVEQFGEKYQTECLTTLLDWCLREEVNDSFNLLEEDERVFDRGEMNIYAEEVTLTNIVIMHLKRLLRRVFGGGRRVSQAANLMPTVSIRPGAQQDNEEGDNKKHFPESLTSDSLAVLSMPAIIKDKVMTSFTIPSHQVATWLPSAEAAASELMEGDFFLLRDIVSMVVEELNILLVDIPAITTKTPFVCRNFERQVLRLYRCVMVVTSLGKYDVTQKDNMTQIETTLFEKLAATAPHINQLVYIMLREIKKATCVLTQTLENH